ncbi:MAG: prepilin-type N-terminal cleavage/methylation domain-containing protein [Planctomycetota bacterium]
MRNTKASRAGFTLLEVVIVIGIFGLVLVGAYQILDQTLQAEQLVEKMTSSGKYGQAILGLIRRDLQSAVFKGHGKQIFLGEDHGESPSASDTLHFITTAPVGPPPDGVEWSGEFAGVGYALGRGEDGVFTLFRRVKHNTREDPLDGGRYEPVYERMKSLSFQYLDRGSEWVTSWNAEERLPADDDNTEDIEAEEGMEEAPSGLSGDTPDESDDESEEEPPLVLPRAVLVEIQIFLGDETGIRLGPNNERLFEVFKTIVPILVTEELELDPELLGDADSSSGDSSESSGTSPGTGTSGSQSPSGGSSGASRAPR